MKVKVLLERKIFLIENLLTKEECERLTVLMTSENTETIGVSGQSHRVCERSVVEMPDLGASLWARVSKVMEEHKVMKVVKKEQHLFSGQWDAIGLNERFRLVRYKKGGHFAPYCDSYYERSVSERSFWTLNIYLNTLPAEYGGVTSFLLPGHPCLDVQPRAGSACLFFQPNTLHCGAELTGGSKYLLRTDVMFRRREGSHQKLTEEQEEALVLYRRAEEQELGQEQDMAWRLYARAFKLWPHLETQQFREPDFMPGSMQ